MTITEFQDIDWARVRAHQRNIDCCRRLLATQLSELEHDFILRGLAEEQASLDILSGTESPASTTFTIRQSEIPHSRMGAQPNDSFFAITELLQTSENRFRRYDVLFPACGARPKARR